MIQAILDEGGYKVNTTSKSVYENPARVETLNKTVDTLQSDIASLESQIAQASTRGGTGNVQQLQLQLNQKRSQLNGAMKDLGEEQKKVQTVFESSVEKAPDPRVQQLRDQGKNSEADALESQLAQQETDFMNQSDRINKLFLDAAEKAISGDFSITPEQEMQIQDIASKFKDPILTAIDSLKAEIGATEGITLESLDAERGVVNQSFMNVSDALDALAGRIQQTGLETESALVEAQARVMQTGTDLNTALDASIAASRALAENNLFESTKDLRMKNAQLAVSLGRASTDPAFIAQLNQDVLDAVKSTELNLAVQQASGKLQITERTGAALESIANFRVDLALDQGKRLESVATSRAQLEAERGSALTGIQQRETDTRSQAGLRREDVARLRAGVEEQAGKVATGLRLNAAQPFSQFEAGTSAVGTLTNLGQVGFNNLLTANQPIQQQIAGQQGLRMAQPTTTTTQSGGLFQNILSGLGVAASGAGAVMGGVGSLRKPSTNYFF